MPSNPLCEVFGFPVENMTETAHNHRRNRLCPFHNPTGANCTKTSVVDPVGDEQRFVNYLQHRIDDRRLSNQPEPSAIEPTIEPLTQNVLPDES